VIGTPLMKGVAERVGFEPAGGTSQINMLLMTLNVSPRKAASHIRMSATAPDISDLEWVLSANSGQSGAHLDFR